MNCEQNIVKYADKWEAGRGQGWWGGGGCRSEKCNLHIKYFDKIKRVKTWTHFRIDSWYFTFHSRFERNNRPVHCMAGTKICASVILFIPRMKRIKSSFSSYNKFVLLYFPSEISFTRGFSRNPNQRIVPSSVEEYCFRVPGFSR